MSTTTDHCIITKYDLSEREKELKKAFFCKKDEKKENIVKKMKKYTQIIYIGKRSYGE